MPYFKYTVRSEENLISYYWEVPNGEEEAAAATATYSDGRNTMSMSGFKGETSPSCYKTKYKRLPHYLKSCLDYCALLLSFYGPTFGYGSIREKERVARLIVAEGLIEDKAVRNASSLEDLASSFIDELVGLGMLISLLGFRTYIQIPEAYFCLCVLQGNREDFVARNVDSPIRLFIDLDDGTELSPDLQNLPVQSLFISCSSDNLSQATLDTLCGFQYLSVLELKNLTSDGFSFNEVEKLVNLRFLSLLFRQSSKIQLASLQYLQTLELYEVTNNKVKELIHIKTLRNFQTYQRCIFKLPKGLGQLVNLQTLPVIDARSAIVGECSCLTQLRQLDVGYVAEENIKELLETILTMENLISLSMAAEIIYYQQKYIKIFPFLEPFSPPSCLQKLKLSGTLMELPTWFASMKNLTILVLNDSYLADNPCLVLQFLPKLKFLRLTNAYNAKLIGKDFCFAGGFPELETLDITSDNLVEWTEIVVGAFPCLTSLICVCPNLMFLPKGLQNISTFKELQILAHEDLKRRLIGEENYKIKHIPSIRMYSN